MMKVIVASICLVLALPAWAFPGFSKKHHVMHTAKVISQHIGSYNAGAAAVPVGNMLFAAPVTRESNIVVVETTHYRLTWSEKGRHMLVLPVNGKIHFYQDKNWFVVVDSRGKKHKFALIHEEALESSGTTQ